MMLGKTLELWLFGALKVPMIFYLRPRVEELGDERAIVRVPLSRRARNHLGSMYFGALTTAADMVPGMMAVTLGRKHGRRVSFAFRDCEVQFTRRALGDVRFLCGDAKALEDAILESIQDRERKQVRMRVSATCRGKGRDEQVAEFAMTLSVRAE